MVKKLFDGHKAARSALVALLGLLPALPGAAQTGSITPGSITPGFVPSITSGAIPSISAAPPLTTGQSVPTNANAADFANAEKLCALLAPAVAARDANTLALFDAPDDWHNYTGLHAQAVLTHLSAGNSGALARQQYQIFGRARNENSDSLIVAGTHDLWLARNRDGSFAFTTQRWLAPADASSALADAAREEWKNTGDEDAPAGILHLVAERRAGRWIALRRTRWSGQILDPEQLSRAARAFTGQPDEINAWLQSQMAELEKNGAGTGHFFMQAGKRGWIGIGAAWDANRNLNAAAETQLVGLRRSIEGLGFTRPQAHRDFGVALSQVGLGAEAADELQKAEALQPGLVGAAQLAQVAKQRSSDPQILAAEQLQKEAKVGLDTGHPIYVINALIKEQGQPRTPVQALRLGLEYSKLAEDEQAERYHRLAKTMIDRGGLANSSAADAGWAEVLMDHLGERERYRNDKPPCILRSALFTVRCTANDLDALRILAALEAGQHTVYADFGIPMGSTEVIVWPTQSAFQRYTSIFSPQGASEFVAALTLTKLIATQDGPLVLGEEVNTFNDPRANIFSTVAHEYGHVAVRQLSRGRLVPVWLNEGIAAAVEGGYDGYLPRVRKAANARRLIGWNELQAWQFDGERAFLAYSQANSAVDFMVATWGREALLEILRQLGRDLPPDAAFRKVTGLSQAEVWTRWSREGIR